MTTVDIYDAMAQLSKLVDLAAAGEDVVIARGGKPVARLTRIRTAKRALKFGVLKGKIKVAIDFDAELPREQREKFNGQ